MFKHIFLKNKVPKNLSMYILVRQDLSETYRMIQGMHGLSQYAIEANNELMNKIKNSYVSTKKSTLFRTWNNQHIICLAVENLNMLREWQKKLDEMGKVYVPFYETCLDNQITSIACIDTGEIFSELKLLK